MWPKVGGSASYKHLRVDARVELDREVGHTLWRTYARGCCIAKGMVDSKDTDLESAISTIQQAFNMAMRSRGWRRDE